MEKELVLTASDKILFLFNLAQLLGQLGNEDGQQRVVHPLHVRPGADCSARRHRRLLRQHPARRPQGNRFHLAVT